MSESIRYSIGHRCHCQTLSLTSEIFTVLSKRQEPRANTRRFLSDTQVNRCVPAHGAHGRVLRTSALLILILIGQQSHPNRWPSAARAQRSSEPQQAAAKASAARWRPRHTLKLSNLFLELYNLPVSLIHGPSHLRQVVSELVLDRVASSVRGRRHRTRCRRPQRWSSRSPDA